MKIERWIRVLILAELIAGVLGLYIDFVFVSSLPVSLQQYLLNESSQGMSAGDTILFALALILLAALVVAWAGLWMLKRWARVVYTTVVFLGFVTTLFVGPVVSSAQSVTLSGVSTLAGGIILGIIWFSKLRSRFDYHRA